jgi:ABC-type Mn2+/Zn2+ transport system permease subunit
MISENLVFLVVVGAFVAAAAGYIGSFMVLKRMALVGDALSHVALPGMAIALTFNFSPILGAFVALTLALIGVWYLEEHSDIYPEALIGIFFTASLALGVLITPEPDLLEALFGNIEKISVLEGCLAILISVVVILVLRLISNKLILGVISEELAKSMRISISRVNLIYLLLVGTVVALGVKFVGTLLMGALVIVPAASAKNISDGIKTYYLYSIAFGVMSAAVGIVAANFFKTATGPAVVLTSIAIFVLTYLSKK